MDFKWGSSNRTYIDSTFLIDNPHQETDTGFPVCAGCQWSPLRWVMSRLVPDNHWCEK